MFETGHVKYDPVVHPSEMSVEQLEAQLKAECAVLKYEVAEFRARMQKHSLLPKAAGALALNAGKSAGKKAMSQARRDPLPFAAAFGGISWLVANVLVGRNKSDVDTQATDNTKESATGLPSGYIPALGLLLGAGTIIGARLVGRKK